MPGLLLASPIAVWRSRYAGHFAIGVTPAGQLLLMHIDNAKGNGGDIVAVNTGIERQLRLLKLFDTPALGAGVAGFIIDNHLPARGQLINPVYPQIER